MKEREFQKKVIDELTNAGCFVFKVHGGLMQKVGIPDIYFGHKLVQGWIELKVDGRKLKPIQRIRMEQMKAKGIKCAVLRWLATDEGAGIFLEDENGKIICNLRWQIKGLIGVMFGLKENE